MAKTKDDDANEAKKMPLLDHLIELRQRLLYAAVGLVVAFFACWFVAQDILDFLMMPLKEIYEAEANRVLPAVAIWTSPTEKFFVFVKLSFFGALAITFPILAGQIWAFVAPGLYRHEKGAFLPFLLATPILFIIGAALLYYVLLPIAWQFFLSFQTTGNPDAIDQVFLPKIGEYVSLVMKLVFAFGLSFQLPVLLTLMAKVGMVTSDGLKRKWRYAVVIVFVVAAVITPPDPISQLSLAIPLVILYTISIYTARLMERSRERREREQQEEAAAEEAEDAAVPAPSQGT